MPQAPFTVNCPLEFERQIARAKNSIPHWDELWAVLREKLAAQPEFGIPVSNTHVRALPLSTRPRRTLFYQIDYSCRIVTMHSIFPLESSGGWGPT